MSLIRPTRPIVRGPYEHEGEPWFRCGVAAERGLYDGEPVDLSYWEPDWSPQDDALDDGLGRCPLCGCVGACGWDEEGRALIHPVPADEDGST